MTKAAAVLIALALTAASPRAQAAADLRSFYIASQAVFGIWSDDIVSVEPVAHDARVRAMRVVSVNEVCPQIRVVQAAERLVPRTTVQAVARVPICEMSQQTIDRAIERAKPPRSAVVYPDYMGSALAVVADCGGQRQVLYLRDEGPYVEFERLRRIDPMVSALWDLRYNLSRRMLPTSAQTPTPEVERLGVTLLPELRSAKYAIVFGDSLLTALKDYTVPPTARLPVPEVLERDALPLIAFVPPTYPPIAVAARMAGDVRLRVTVDAASGSITHIETLSDEPILGDAAVAAVRGWKFDTAKAPQAINVTVRFDLRCRKD